MQNSDLAMSDIIQMFSGLRKQVVNLFNLDAVALGEKYAESFRPSSSLTINQKRKALIIREIGGVDLAVTKTLDLAITKKTEEDMPLRGQNALIESVSLSIGDHGCLTAWLNLQLTGGSSISFGGFRLAVLDEKAGRVDFLIRSMQIAGVQTWEALPGCKIRVLFKKGVVHSIGHFLNDDWYSVEE